MGSPISPVVANLYIEYFESRTLDTAPSRPALWYRYVDDTMTKLHKYAENSFSDYLNATDQNIQFTSEKAEKKRMNSTP